MWMYWIIHHCRMCYSHHNHRILTKLFLFTLINWPSSWSFFIFKFEIRCSRKSYWMAQILWTISYLSRLRTKGKFKFERWNTMYQLCTSWCILHCIGFIYWCTHAHSKSMRHTHIVACDTIVIEQQQWEKRHSYDERFHSTKCLKFKLKFNVVHNRSNLSGYSFICQHFELLITFDTI